MRWLRSFPARVPPGRNYVVDGLDRLTVRDYDLATAPELPALLLDRAVPGVVLVEWDIAFSPEDRREFELFIQFGGLDTIAVAPYRLYPASTGLPAVVWSPRVGEEPNTVHVSEGEPECDHFGFGFVYLPTEYLRLFLESRTAVVRDKRLTDTNFCIWRQARTPASSVPIGWDRGPVPICWDVRPVHLHY